MAAPSVGGGAAVGAELGSGAGGAVGTGWVGEAGASDACGAAEVIAVAPVAGRVVLAGTGGLDEPALPQPATNGSMRMLAAMVAIRTAILLSSDCNAGLRTLGTRCEFHLDYNNFVISKKERRLHCLFLMPLNCFSPHSYASQAPNNDLDRLGMMDAYLVNLCS
jgi:hypothetical protein